MLPPEVLSIDLHDAALELVFVLLMETLNAGYDRDYEEYAASAVILASISIRQ